MHAQNIIVAFIILYRPFIKMLISNDKLKVYMSSNREGIGEGWDWGRIWDWWVLDRQIEEPLWHGGGRECGTGKGATRGKGVGPTR